LFPQDFKPQAALAGIWRRGRSHSSVRGIFLQEEMPTPRTRGCWMVQPPQLTLWDLLPLALTRVSLVFLVRAVFLGEKRLPYTRALEDPSAHSSRCGTCQPPPPPPILLPPCGTNLPLQAKWPAQFHESRTYCKPGLREDAIKPFGLSGQATPVSAGVTARLWTPATW
jgi:hypothetical protein